jgi:arylsulfatase A
MRPLLACLVFALALCATPLRAERRPNIVLIMADDLGYETLGCNGSTSYRTPSLDALAATGMRFEHCHAQPLCTPTRVQLMTGIYNVRNYRRFGLLDPNAITFAHILKQAGYATCIAGKWQLGAQPVDLPQKFGFDESCLWQQTRRPERYRNPGLEINGKQKDWQNGEYGPDLVNAYALDFISRKKDQPFLLYYPMILTHSPYVPTPDSAHYGQGTKRGQRRQAARTDGVNQHFADMVQYMDKLVGKLVAHLDALNLRENTLIIFLGDNGTGQGTVSMLGDKKVIGGKGTLRHTGTHVRVVVNWPGQVAAGKVSADLVDTTDFLPTICEAAGVKVPEKLKIDGRSFLPPLRGEAGNPREWIYCWYAPRGEIVGEFAATGDYKLYRDGRFFDLRRDLEETAPLQVEALEGEGADAARLLRGALRQYAGVKPVLERQGRR